jgi:hypothetical protein
MAHQIIAERVSIAAMKTMLGLRLLFADVFQQGPSRCAIVAPR